MIDSEDWSLKVLLKPKPDYLTQRDNVKLGGTGLEQSNQCFISAATMFCRHVAKEHDMLTVFKMSEYEYNSIILGICQTKKIDYAAGRYMWDIHQSAINALLKPLSVKRVNATKDLIRSQIDLGYPVIIGIDISHYLKGASGHMVLCIGYDDKGLVIHDPYGDALTGYKNHNGESVHYDWNELQNMISENTFMFEVHYVS